MDLGFDLIKQRTDLFLIQVTTVTSVLPSVKTFYTVKASGFAWQFRYTTGDFDDYLDSNMIIWVLFQLFHTH